MKLYLTAYICIILTALQVHSSTTTSHTGNIAPSTAPVTQISKVDPDTKVVAESMGTMISALATFSQNPNNPVIAGACALQALGAFIKMLIQIFDEASPTRAPRRQEEIEHWFVSLPREKQLKIMQLLLTYIHIHSKT